MRRPETVGAVAVTNRTEVTKITVACLLMYNLSLCGLDARSACGVKQYPLDLAGGQQKKMLPDITGFLGSAWVGI